MRLFSLRVIALSLLLVSAHLGTAQTPAERAADQRANEHYQRLKRLYPSATWATLMDGKAPYQAYQVAVNQAATDGIPRSILHEMVALRAMRNADVRSLQQILPYLKKNLETFRPETSIFDNPRSASFTVKTIEKTLAREQEAPGAVAKGAAYAKEMEVARAVRDQLNYVESLVDMHAIANHANIGDTVTEEQWRKQAGPESRWAKLNTDEYGSPIGPQVVDQKPTVPKATYEHFKTIVEDTFWQPYGIPK